jgi:hypothetical protein
VLSKVSFSRGWGVEIDNSMVCGVVRMESMFWEWAVRASKKRLASKIEFFIKGKAAAF